MKLKDRFLDFWHNSGHEEYKYNLSILEMLCYTVIGSIVVTAEIVIIVGSMPIWIIPYLVYKVITIRKGKKNGK